MQVIELQRKYKDILSNLEYNLSDKQLPNKLFHILYKTTNLINGKYYIGRHSTNNLNDGYLGSGISLNKAINKYGIHNFKREILHMCDTYIEVCAMEELFVNKEFIESESNYNLCTGGYNIGITSYKSRLKQSNSLKRHYQDPSNLKDSSERAKRYWDTPEGRLQASFRTKSTHGKPEVKDRISKSQKISIKHIRPWQVQNQHTKTSLPKYKRLDEIFDLFKSHNFKITNELHKEAWRVFNFYPSDAMYKYLLKYGDPRSDDLWVKFKL